MDADAAHKGRNGERNQRGDQAYLEGRCGAVAGPEEIPPMRHARNTRQGGGRSSPAH